ncbi:MAG: methyl-accepting chemotaxis protein [bacterium]
MFKRLKFRQKILLIPGLSIFVLLVVICMGMFLTNKNSVLLNKIVSGYIPEKEFYTDLVDELNNFKNNVDQACSDRDVSILQQFDQQKDQFNEMLKLAKDNPVVDSENINNINNMIMEYLIKTKGTTEHILNGREDEVLDEIQEQNELFQQLTVQLSAHIREANMDISRSFQMARNNNKNMVVIILSVIIVLSIIFILVSLFVIKSISKSIKDITKISEQIRDGNLSIEVSDMAVDDEISKMFSTFTDMVTSLREFILQIKEGAQKLAAASGQISTSVSEIAAGATETASAANETSTTVEEVRQTAKDSNQKAKDVTQNAQKVVEISQTGSQSVADTIKGMHHIEDQMGSLAESIMKLSEHGQDIGEIIVTVEDVAEQSRLLAVNASIEAVKAGEYGKGFAVVAEEVRKLAEKSKHATTRVRSILDDIQNATSEAVMQTEQGNKAVEAGVNQSKKAGEAIQKLTGNVTEASQSTTQISVSSQEQLVGMDQVVSAMENIKNASSQNVNATKQVEEATTELYQFGKQLTELLQKYKL